MLLCDELEICVVIVMSLVNEKVCIYSNKIPLFNIKVLCTMKGR